MDKTDAGFILGHGGLLEAGWMERQEGGGIFVLNLEPKANKKSGEEETRRAMVLQ